MKNFKISFKEAIKKSNANNPNSRQVTLKSTANEVGVFPQYLSQLTTNGNKALNLHLQIVFSSSDKKEILKKWKLYCQEDIKIINRLDKICKFLGCEIYDIITEVKDKKI